MVQHMATWVREARDQAFPVGASASEARGLKGWAIKDYLFLLDFCYRYILKAAKFYMKKYNFTLCEFLPWPVLYLFANWDLSLSFESWVLERARSYLEPFLIKDNEDRCYKFVKNEVWL